MLRYSLHNIHSQIYWLGYPSTHSYVKCIGHEKHDNTAIITGATLGLKSNQAVAISIAVMSCTEAGQAMQD